ncbi:MAG TPA: TlpA disulfide reductase family protein [Dehalococcoidales bacterium]|nr:TlpA disulfide reductase family protein [Dehalococcoidales bacterium]
MIVKKLSVSLALVLVLSLLFAGCTGTQQSGQSGNPAPDFSLKSATGETVSLSSLRGRVVLINFWSTTCQPCVQEMPHFEELHQEWQNRNDVKMLMINTGESAAVVKNFLDSRNLTFTVLLDEGVKIAQKYKVRYTPTTLIVDKNGIIRQSVAGAFRNKAAIEKFAAPYLAE